MESFDLAVVAGTQDYDLSDADDGIPAPGFWKLRGVDYLVSADKPVTLKPFNFAERDKIRSSAPFSRTRRGSGAGLKYWLRGSTLRFEPEPDANATVRIWYVPKRPKLVTVVDPAEPAEGEIEELPAVIEPRWEQVIVLEAAIQFLNKEATDTTALLIQKRMILADLAPSVEDRDAGEPQRMVRRTSDEYEP